MNLCWGPITARLSWSSSKSGEILRIQITLDAKKRVLEKYIKFSNGLFLKVSYWYNLILEL
jgi:hypothetical protein